MIHSNSPLKVPTKGGSNLVSGIDLLRAIAAMLVVAGHTRNLFFVDYGEIANRGWLTKPIYFLTGLGHEAVIIFFVLSGLLVGGKALETIQNGSWSWTRYLIDRGSRLCIVLWPALLLTFFWSYLGDHLFGSSGPIDYSPLGSNVIPQDLAAALTPRVYLSNALFLQGIWTAPLGTNSSLWSLSYEFWFYLAFPALMIALQRGASFKVRAKNFLVFLLTFSILTRARMTECFVIWLMGVGVARFGRRLKVNRLLPLLLGLAVVVLIGALVAARGKNLLFADPVLGLATSFLCLWLLHAPSQQKSVVSTCAAFLSSFSYTLYLTHLPLLVFVRGAFLDLPRWQPTLLNVTFGAAICLTATVWAYLVYRVTERYTPQLRRFLLDKALPKELSQLPNPKSKAA